jgi:hypothetical protein
MSLRNIELEFVNTVSLLGISSIFRFFSVITKKVDSTLPDLNPGILSKLCANISPNRKEACSIIKSISLVPSKKYPREIVFFLLDR